MEEGQKCCVCERGYQLSHVTGMLASLITRELGVNIAGTAQDPTPSEERQAWLCSKCVAYVLGCFMEGREIYDQYLLSEKE